MKPLKILLLCTLPLLSMSAAGDQVTLQNDAADLRAVALKAAPAGPLANTRRETVSFTAAVDPHQSLSGHSPFVAVSREYRVSVSAGQLRDGVTVRTTGPGAVVALSPLSVEKGAGLSPLDLSVTTPQGTVLRGSDAMDQLVDRAALQATGISFSNGMVGFRFNRALADGDFLLRADKGALASRYQLHVLDKQGSAELSLGAPQQTLVGQAFEASGQLIYPGNDPALRSVSAFILSPDGERSDASVAITGNRYSVSAGVAQSASFDSGLWELHVSALDESGLQRDVKTAFAAAYPTARLDGVIERDEFGFDVGIEAVSAGRYEVSAVLFGTIDKGGRVPVATSATAQWLERGAGIITLSFDEELVLRSGARAPYTLRSVTLKDQSRLSVLERVTSSSGF